MKKELLKDVYRLAEDQEHLSSPIHWEVPEQLGAANLPVFDTTVFPKWLGAYVEAVAHYTQTPPDPAAVAALGVLSTVLQKKVYIKADWTEPLNLYTILAHDPGNRKSAVFRAMKEPIDRWERQETERLAPEIDIQESNLKELIQRQNYKINEAAKAKSEEKRQAAKDEVDILTHEIRKAQEDLKRAPRLYTDDVTGEKLAIMMAHQGGSMALLTAEGAGPLRNMAGRYDKQSADSSMAIYLKAHSGDDVAVDRVGRESVKLHKPALTLCLFLQPDTLQGLTPEFHNNGLMARFLFSFPPSYVGSRSMKPAPVPDSLKTAYQSAIRAFLNFSPETPIELWLSREADALFLKCREETEALLAEDGELEANGLRNWGSKLDGALMRIIGLVHVAENADKIPNIPPMVEADTVRCVLKLKPYLIQHAKKAYGVMEKREGNSLARYVLNKIIEKHHGAQFATFRELHQPCRRKSGLREAEKFENVLKHLERMQYLVIETEKRSKKVWFNPLLFEEPEKYIGSSQDVPTSNFVPSENNESAMSTSKYTSDLTEKPTVSMMEGSSEYMSTSSGMKRVKRDFDGSGVI